MHAKVTECRICNGLGFIPPQERMGEVKDCVCEGGFMDMKQGRQQLGLSLSEFAALHRVSVLAVRRWEYPVGSSGHREPSGSAVAFTQALLDGYRPAHYEQEKVK